MLPIASSISIGLFRELGAEHVHALDRRRRREQVRRLRHERLRDRPVQMRLPPRLVPNASKIANVVGPSRSANQSGVVVS